jgi:hypothetical protein
MKATPKQSLFQVNVETRDGKLVRVGPAMMREACEKIADSIKEQIALGREKLWSNPHVVPLITLEN